MSLPRYIPHYTLADYRQWQGDWELWSGVPVAMSPSAKRIHQRICGRLFRQISDQLDAAGCSHCEAVFEVDWVVSEDTVFRPDLLIVCHPKASDFVEKTPTLIAEVLSDSTRQRDLIHKRAAYQDLGVKYYLILDPKNETDSVLINNGKAYEASDKRTLQIDSDCEIGLNLDGLFE